MPDFFRSIYIILSVTKKEVVTEKERRQLWVCVVCFDSLFLDCITTFYFSFYILSEVLQIVVK